MLIRCCPSGATEQSKHDALHNTVLFVKTLRYTLFLIEVDAMTSYIKRADIVRKLKNFFMYLFTDHQKQSGVAAVHLPHIVLFYAISVNKYMGCCVAEIQTLRRVLSAFLGFSFSLDILWLTEASNFFIINFYIFFTGT